MIRPTNITPSLTSVSNISSLKVPKVFVKASKENSSNVATTSRRITVINTDFRLAALFSFFTICSTKEINRAVDKSNRFIVLSSFYSSSCSESSLAPYSMLIITISIPLCIQYCFGLKMPPILHGGNDLQIGDLCEDD